MDVAKRSCCTTSKGSITKRSATCSGSRKARPSLRCSRRARSCARCSGAIDMHPNESSIHDYVDETLDARQRGEVERHLAGCADCRRLVDDLREIRTAVGQLNADL